ncbi:hypothetical protein OYT1_ch0451 [Ferriphaselus amnicola]|uniref:Uncharacterized protein n=1 Tax=Ferriphaselus amnicola TaxID=1188319 RepID=A0A2Z6G9F3_9PROT|nr:hypothetical protein [Ferriphaselus amnicola]BBE50024.1 hypothetical protein OYT1_ch0451 [Ferriphaselus amnicola]
MRTIECVCISLGICIASHSHAQELGRLLYTPEQRQQLERGKATTSSSPMLNGIVQKHGSGRTIWLDNQAELHASDVQPDSQPFAQSGHPAVRIKVGERVP